MMGVAFNVKGADETGRRMRRTAAAIGNLDLSEARSIARMARRRAPKDTGDLRASISADIAEHKASIGSTGVRHAIPVHQGVDRGNRRIEARPFLTEAVDAKRAGFIRSVRDQVRNIVRRGNR